MRYEIRMRNLKTIINRNLKCYWISRISINQIKVKKKQINNLSFATGAGHLIGEIHKS